MVHLGISGLNIHENSHRTRKQDGEYNIHIINAIRSKNWVKKVENIGTVSQVGRTSGKGSQGGGDLYRQWLAGEHYVKFSLKSRDGKKTYYL